jgi:signal transduction histidine kinase/DNA-binding response OmpR family regulator
MADRSHILMVTEPASSADALGVELGRALPEARIHTAPDSTAFELALGATSFDAAVIDDAVRWIDGVDAVRQIVGQQPDCATVMVLDTENMDRVLRAMQRGLDDHVLRDAPENANLATAVAGALRRTATKLARRQQRARATFLASVTTVLSSSLDLDTLLGQLAGIAVPTMADGCIVHLVRQDGSVRHAAAHYDSDRAAHLRELQHRFPLDVEEEPGPADLLRGGATLWIPVVRPERIRTAAFTPGEMVRLGELGPTSVLVVALAARAHRLGAVTFLSTTPGRHFTPDDVVFAEDFVRRAALAVDNARLFDEAQQANAQIARLSIDLRRRVGELETLLDVIPIGIGIAEDPGCRRIRANPVLARYLAVDPALNASLSAPEEERPPFWLMHDGRALREEEMPMQKAAWTGEEVRDVEVDVHFPDGSSVTLLESASPLFDEQGRVRGAVGAFLDITERKRAAQQERFLSHVSVVLAGTLDLETRIRSFTRLVTPALSDWALVDLTEPDGSVKRYAGSHADAALEAETTTAAERLPFARHAKCLVHAAMRTGVAQVKGRALPHEWPHLLGRDRTGLLERLRVASLLVVPLKHKGRVLGAFTLASCVPYRYSQKDLPLALELGMRLALEIENARLYQEAREANRLKDEFLATVSHELRTPLNAMLGWARLLRTGALPPEMVTRALDIIERNIDAQAVLINDLLDISRVVSGKLRLTMGRLDVRTVIQAAIDSVRGQAEAKRIVIHVEVEVGAGNVVADGDRLRQVVWNLLSNAVKFTPDEGRIDVAARAVDGGIDVAVKDSGIGISPEFLPYVFERFRQADSSTTRQHGGLGLGLSIARHLVELHGGHIRVHSEGSNQGATFTVHLPARDLAPEAVDDVRLGERERRNLHRCRVLAVDDDADSRGMLALVLRSAGADVAIASSAAEALEQFRAFHPHVLVTDIAMAGEDGYELVRKVRLLDEAEGGRVPAIALTARARAEDRRHAFAAGFDAHLAKPVAPHVLCDTIASLLGADVPLV